MSAQTSIDPVVFAGRACSGTGQEVFFPETRKLSERRPAIRLCQACPVLELCAAYAAPLVATKAITGCVIASVYAPRHVALYDGERAAAAAELEAIAAGAITAGEVAA